MSNRTAEATLPLSAQPTRQVAVIDIGTSSIRMAVAEINAASVVVGADVLLTDERRLTGAIGDLPEAAARKGAPDASEMLG